MHLSDSDSRLDLDLDLDLDSNDSSPLSLEQLGFHAFFQRQLESLPECLVPARVVAGSLASMAVIGARGRMRAIPSGKLKHDAADASLLPAVGDWVGLRPDIGDVAVIAHVFARRTALLRKAIGKRLEAQVLAANVDAVMIVSAFNADFNPRRLERYFEVALEGGARPIVVLNKADLRVEGHAGFVEVVREIAPSVPIVSVSALDGRGMDELLSHVHVGETMAIIGSSGVGKSTIVNRLIGARAQDTGEIRAHDDRGKHTTTGRELFVMPSGALLVDTPGLRELAPWGSSGEPAGFDDVEAFAAQCRFRDCAHAGEPGCAVEAAIARGELQEGRFEGFQKLAKEGRHLAVQKDARARVELKRQFRARAKITKRSPKT